ncbi:MAG: SPOR domain-containing protein [Treponema sp.]|nr:SPOR domain-containing protein [Candidatus Treponema scatequi]
MKKIFYLVLTVCAGLILMSSSPSLDGRAVVADKGVFPAGLFAKTVGYLPGDSISVTNPANGQNIEILVIGSLDPSEGVAVMLSPEAADCLGIKKNSNMLVKLTKRSGELDENANGTCVLTQAKAPAVTEKEEEIEEKEEEIVEVEEAQEVMEIADTEVIDEEVPAEIEEVAVTDNTEEDFVVPEEGIEEDTIPEEDKPVIVDNTYIPEEEGVDEDEIPEEETEDVAPLVVEDNYVVPEEEGVEEDDIPEEDKPAIVDNTYIPEEEGVEEDEIPEEDKPVIVDNAVIPDEEEIEEDELPPEEIAEEEEEDFDSIVLVPAEENPPEAEDEPLEEEIEEPAPAEESVIADVIEPEPVVEPVVEKPVEKEFEAPVEVTSGSFEKGKWYIQIGVYAKQENVNEIIRKYGKKYPIFIDQKNSKNYVLIGPLTMDEYGAVLQRFKAFGYKDAFVKKIK